MFREFSKFIKFKQLKPYIIRGLSCLFFTKSIFTYIEKGYLMQIE